MSTVVYFTHMYIWTIYYMLIYGETTFGIDCFLVTAGVSLFIAFLYVYLKKPDRLNRGFPAGTIRD